MANPRKATSQVEARRRARERAAQFREREIKLEQAAAEYFVRASEVDAIRANTEAELARVAERGGAEVADALRAADDLILEMLNLDISRSEVAARLGVEAKEVRRVDNTRAKRTTVQSSASPDASVVGDAADDAPTTEAQSGAEGVPVIGPDEASAEPWQDAAANSDERVHV